MPMPRARAIGVGAFVIGGLVLFAFGLFLIGDRRMFFSQTFEVRAYFARIAGLQDGAKVRVGGMDAGEVKEIHVPLGPTAKFMVVMRVRSDLRPLVRADSVASIQNDGLVGNKFVQIEPGTDQATQVADKGTIQSREPFDMADLLQKMSDTVDTVNATVVQVRAELEETLGSITDTAQTAQGVVAEVGAQIEAIAASGQKVTADVSAIVADVKQGRGTVGKLVTDDALYRQARDIADQAQKTVASLREASEQARKVVADLQSASGSVKGVTGNLAQTLTYAREAMADLAENTEALKHNFFLRGFFNRRGYFDLQNLTVQQYRDGALEAAGRVPLRIWLKSSVIFAADANGREALTDLGRQRLDSAMSQFVRYPGNSPLVVEGYAQNGTADERFLLSRSRAELARAHVVSRFSLDPRTVAMMPMGSAASDSPAGSTWDGVALTLFVARDALAEKLPVAQGLIDRR